MKTMWVVCTALAAFSVAASHAEEEASQAPIRVEMDEVEIEGEIERPEVFYIIPRREVRMDLGALSRDFRSEIMEPLLPRAFEHWARPKGLKGEE